MRTASTPRGVAHASGECRGLAITTFRVIAQGKVNMAAGRGRPPGFVMSEEHRTKISNSKILKRLIECAEGETEMTPTQATVALGLLKKVMPDLQSTQINGPGENGEHTITFKTVYE